jgi:hypothetical protein
MSVPSVSKRGTYFYNIQKSEENVIDNYRIWYNNYVDNNHLFESYEEYLSKFILENQPESEKNLNYNCSKLVEDTITYNVTTISYSFKEVYHEIEIKLDNDNPQVVHVKVFLINLLDIPNSENKLYTKLEALAKENKEIIIQFNKYFNERKEKEIK